MIILDRNPERAAAFQPWLDCSPGCGRVYYADVLDVDSLGGGMQRCNQADVLGHALELVETGETSAVGVAAWPLLAAGLLKNVEQVAQYEPISGIASPKPEATAFYATLYERYKSLYDPLK